MRRGQGNVAVNGVWLKRRPLVFVPAGMNKYELSKNKQLTDYVVRVSRGPDEHFRQACGGCRIRTASAWSYTHDGCLPRAVQDLNVDPSFPFEDNVSSFPVRKGSSLLL
jgi:hypothetical protein